MKKSIKYVLILSFYFCFSQKNTTIPQALNIAAKQSMLSQRLANQKMLRITNPSNKNISQKLAISLLQFEENISILEKMDFPPYMLSQIATLEMLWIGYKINIKDTNPKTVAKTMKFNNIMLWLCKDVFKDILMLSEVKNLYPYTSTKTDLPEAYIASNNLKYLSQQLSLNYNAFASKMIKYDAKNFTNIISEINDNILGISKVEHLDTEIKEKTTLVTNQWTNLKSNIDKATASNFAATDNYPKAEFIFKECDSFLKNIDLLTRLYRANNDTN